MTMSRHKQAKALARHKRIVRERNVFKNKLSATMSLPLFEILCRQGHRLHYI